ncbi:MAG: ABC transporter permease [Thermoflexales bacterium]|nr:ABC transporter permease [Thermoflexales bacterium]
MSRFITQRLIVFAPTLFGVAVIVFVVMRLIPGDTITAQIGTQTLLTDAQAASLRAYYGLDKPVLEQFTSWFGAALRGDLGLSVRSGKPVLGEILSRFPLTLELGLLALLIGLVLGLTLGMFTATRRGTLADAAGQFLALIGLALPNFWLGTLIILVLSTVFHILPNSGDYTPFSQDPLRNLGQLIFPAFTLGLGLTASIARTTRSAVLEELRQDYARTARSKGLSERWVTLKHCFRNALLPVITLVGIQAGYLLGGAIVVEEVFALPGLGRLLLNAIGQRDYAVTQGVILFIALNFLLINLLADLAYALVNPRVRNA